MKLKYFFLFKINHNDNENCFFFYRNVKRSQDYGKNVVWPKPPNVLESLVAMLQSVHHR